MRLLLIFLFSPLYFFGQTSYKGKVISATSKAIIPFATIGLIKENIGTNANENGTFSLISKSTKVDDSLVISCIGYLTKKLPIDGNNKSDLVIELIEQETILDEVVVRNRLNWSVETLNDFWRCGNDFITTSGYQTQLAQHFHVKEENSILTRVKICRWAIPLLAPEKTIFRIRIYDMDTVTRTPSKDLCDQIIEVKTSSKIINLNLEKYNIHIPSKDFFVAIEWLKIPFNESKGKMVVNGKEVDHITYRPSIGWSDNVNPQMEAWALDYRNVWRPMFKMINKTSVSISATVKY